MPERTIAVRAENPSQAAFRAIEAARKDQLPGGLVWVTFRVIAARDMSIAGPSGPDHDLLFEVDLLGDVMTESEARAMDGDR